ISAGADYKIYEAFSLSFSWSYRQLVNATNLLFFDAQSASARADYNNTELGLTIESDLTYKDMEYYSSSQYFPPAFIWNFSASYGIMKNILVELAIDNILNEE